MFPSDRFGSGTGVNPRCISIQRKDERKDRHLGWNENSGRVVLDSREIGSTTVDMVGAWMGSYERLWRTISGAI